MLWYLCCGALLEGLLLELALLLHVLGYLCYVLCYLPYVLIVHELPGVRGVVTESVVRHEIHSVLATHGALEQTNKQTYKQTNKQTNKQKNKQTNKHNVLWFGGWVRRCFIKRMD